MDHSIYVHLDSNMTAFKLLSSEQLEYLNQYSIPRITSEYEYVWDVPIGFFYTVSPDLLYALIMAIADKAYTSGTERGF